MPKNLRLIKQLTGCFCILQTLIPISLYAQRPVISGKVFDVATNNPLIGVTVSLKGTQTGTFTNVNGSYHLSIPNSGDTLEFSFLGYLKRDFAVRERRFINVGLSATRQSLNEVVVVGYGTQQKSDVTGSIVTLKGSTILQVPSPNLIAGLQGRASGVDIVSNSSNPGAIPQIRIRGDRTLTTTASADDAQNGPLVVVDGIPYSGNINDINPDDIANVSILKDASATAIYGSRGSGGVIIITTKRGTPGRQVFTYNAYYGVDNITGEYPVFNGPQYAAYKTAAAAGNNVNPGTNAYGLTTAEAAGLAKGVSTDWQKLIFRQGYTDDQEISVAGGNQAIQYSMGAGYYKVQGVVPGQNFTRYSIHSTIDDQVNRHIKIGYTGINSMEYTNFGGGDPVGGLVRLSPLTAPYNADGSINLYPQIGALDANVVNPLTLITDQQAIVNNDRRLNTFNSLYGVWQIIPNLKYRINVGLNYSQDQSGTYFGPNTFANGNATALSQANESVGNSESYSATVENLLIFDKTFAGKHRLTFTGLYSVEKDHTQSSGIFGTGIPADYIQNYNLSLANTVNASNSSSNPWNYADRGLISYMARVNYSFENRFLLTATLRTDGSSVLSVGNQYYTYPAFAAGWNMTNERFMQHIKAISYLKLRAGWGITSSQSINPYSTLGALGVDYYNFGPGTAGQNTGYLVQTLGNKNLKWQSTAELNLGADFGLFNNRITGSIDVYNQNTNNILLSESLPPSNGAGSTIVNAGKTKGHGFEISVSSLNIRTHSGFTWRTDVNVSVNRNEVVALQNPTLLADIGNGWFVGQPLSVIYDVKKIGIWQTADSTQAASYGEKPGMIRVQDVGTTTDAKGNPSGGPDGKINAADRQIIGNFEPRWTGGLTNTFSYKGIDLTVVMFARMGMMVVVPYVMSDGGAQGFDFFNNSRNNSLKRNYWTPNNPTNAFPQPNAATDYTNYSSTLGYVDGSFIKVRSIDLGYTIPPKVLEKAGISSLRVYLTVANPFILYSPFVKQGYGPDPEGNGYGGVSTSTVGGTPVPGRAITVNLNTPPTRQFNIGVNLQF